DVVVQLQAVLVEDLQAVVVGWVVRGRDHDAGGEVAGPGEEREGRRRDTAGDPDVASEARRSRGDGRDEHVAGPSRVLADDEEPALADEPVSRRPAERVRERRLQLDVRDPPDPIRSEQPGHVRTRTGPARDSRAGWPARSRWPGR